MTDELQLLADFRSGFPYPDADTAARIYRHATTSVAPGRGLPRFQRRTAVAVAAAVLVLAGVAAAAVKEVPWWQSGSPPVDPQAVASVARDNLPANVVVADARTVAHDGNAALVAVPINGSGYCLIPAIDGHGNLGAQCEYQVTNPQRGDDDRTVSMARPASANTNAAWLVYGRITDPRAAKIDLGALSVSLHTGGFFLARVPENRWSRLDGTANDGRILDQSGGTLRTGCVNWGSSPTDAHQTQEGLPLWTDGNRPCTPETIPQPPTLNLSQATTLFNVTLTQNYSIWRPGTTIHFVQAAASDGTICITSTGPGLPPNAANGGACRRPSAKWTNPQPLIVGFGADRAHANGKAFYDWTITGTTDPSAQITKLELVSPTSRTPIPFANDFFFAEIPATSTSTHTFPTGPWTINAYNAAGTKIASIDLNKTHANATR